MSDIRFHAKYGTRFTQDLLCAVPNIAIVQDWSQEEIEEQNSCEGITCDVKRGSQWCTGIVDLCPVETDGEQAEAGVHLEVIRCQPRSFET